MAIPSSTPEKIREAIHQFDSDPKIREPLGDWKSNKAYKLALVNDGHLYPLKTIISLATGQDVSQFSGGGEAARYVKALGFSVEPLRLPSENETKAALHDLLLLRHPNPVGPAEAYKYLADEFDLSASQRTITMQGSSEVHWENRVRFARRKLVDDGILDGTSRGVWKIRLRSNSRVFVEKCIVEGRPDRQSGEHALGKALWSPTRRVDGADIYHMMRQVQPGDKIIHLVDNRAIVGVSIASDVARPNFVGVEGSDWAGQPSYRVVLSRYEALAPEIKRSEFFDAPEPRRELVKILSNHTGLFYTRDLDLNQGAYLTEAPPPLIGVLNRIYHAKTGQPLPHVGEFGTKLDLKSSRLAAGARIFRWIYGEQGFRATRYLDEERNYKVALSRKWCEAANRDTVAEALGDETRSVALAELLGNLLSKESNLLPWRYAGFLKAPWEPIRAQQFLSATQLLLFDSDPKNPSIDEFNLAMAPYYSELVGPNATKPASHCIPSLMLWLSDPRTQFLVRPSLYNTASQALRGELAEGQGNVMTTGYYLTARSFAESIAAELSTAGLSPEDMIDVQGFLWVVFNSKRVWLGGYSYGGKDNMLTAFVERGCYGINWAKRLEIAQLFEGASELNSDERKERRTALETALPDASERKAVVAFFDLITKPESLILAKSVWFDRATQQSLMRIGGVALPTKEYVFDSELGHFLKVDWRSQPDEIFVLPGALYPKVNSTLSELAIDETLDALSEPAGDVPLNGDAPDVTSPEPPIEAVVPPLERIPYPLERALDQVFMRRDQFERALAIWRRKKNLVLQGAPGVGKSFVGRRLAYALMGFEDPSRLGTVQFHQSYAYEDFVQGYRPKDEGGFELRDGVFIEFCKRAQMDTENTYVFLIDEINRGNLSKILGELMLLIEPDKRSEAWATKLAYSQTPFFVPPNVYLLGLMNTADRSLAVVDYALRRRFAFVTALPAFTSDAFRAHLSEDGVAATLINRICDKMGELNAAIAIDRTNLGPSFCVGHSFFLAGVGAEPLDEEWYQRIIETEIGPLLDEYWFDDQSKAEQWRKKLLE